MRKKILASVAAFAAGAGLAWGQAPMPSPNDPAYISASGQQMLDPNVMPVIGSKEPLYFQGGPGGYGPPRGGGQGHPPLWGGAGCGQDGCGEGGCGEGGNANGCGNLFSGQPGPGFGGQVHKAAGGPDCFFFDVDSLYYYFRSMRVNAPLITAGPIGTTGRLGEDGVRVLVGDNHFKFGPQAALRLNMGAWCEDRIWGLNVSAFITEQRAEVDEFDAPITGRTVLARPTFNILTGVTDAVTIASPPNFGGSAVVYANSRAGGAEVNLMRNWAYYDKFKLTGLAGVRWFSLNEQLRIDSSSSVPSNDPNDPSIRDINDTFLTRNNFYGGQLGFETEVRRGRWFTDVTAKFAAGFTHEKLTQSGFTAFGGPALPGEVIVRDPATRTIVPSGVFVAEPNSGSFSDKQFSWMPEGNVRIGYQWTQRLSSYIGYDIMYISKVVRPGDQVNPNVNPTLLPITNVFNPQFPFGPPEPSLLFKTGDFVMQGFEFGVTYRY
jgi:hypothetical protein